MKKIVVSLISEHTIPNVLAIQHFAPDELLFISTAAMEEKHKTRHLLGALAGMGFDFRGRFHTVTIMEDSLLDCHRKLEDWMTGREDSEFIVNITGGTKIMSIAAYEFFRDYAARMIYVPFPKNEFVTPFPKRISKPEPLTGRLKVVDYLSAYGLGVINGPKLGGIREAAETRVGLSAWMVPNYLRIKKLLAWFCGTLRGARNEKKLKKYDLKEIFPGATTEETEFLRRFGFSLAGSTLEKSLTRSEIEFLTGGWLEEYCFNVVRGFDGAGVDDVVMGIQVRNEKGTDNEFDVMFTSGNALYTVECKSLDQHEDKKTEALYKIGALNKDFGLKVKSFFVSTSPYIMKDGKIRPAVEARAAQFSTIVVTPDRVAEFADVVAKNLKLAVRKGESNV